MIDNMPLLVVLDANVLFPWSLRDTLLRVAEAELYDLRISRQILDEVTRNLRGRQKMTASQAAHFETRVDMFFASLTAFVTDYESLIPTLTNNMKDRHVLAAAVKANAHIVVTFNLKHFPDKALASHDVVALHPDLFLTRLHALYPDMLDNIVREQAAALHRPPVTVAQLLDTLTQHAPRFVRLVRLRLLG